MNGQMSIFDFVNQGLDDSPKPKYKIGDVLYKVILGVVRKLTVIRSYECTDGYGYTVTVNNEHYDTFWDSSIGKNVFKRYEDAEQKAKANLSETEVIRGAELKPIKQRSFIYYRPDATLFGNRPYIISATVALLDRAVYVGDWMSYHFVYCFKTQKEADDTYKTYLNKITDGKDIFHQELTIQKELEDAYKVSDGVYGSYQYAERHGE